MWRILKTSWRRLVRGPFRRTLGLDDLKKKAGPVEARPGASVDTHMLWVTGSLSQLELLSIQSFIKQGYRVTLWTYGGVTNAPAGARLCDGREILPEDALFLNRRGSHAGFSDLFRYAVLSQRGGLWADTDVVCLAPVAELVVVGNNGFLVTERSAGPDRLTINGNLIYHPEPKRGDLADLAFAFADRYDKATVDWNEIGPRLLTVLASNYPNLVPNVMEPGFANPVDHWNCPKLLLKPGQRLADRAKFLHCYNEMWRREGIDKNLPYPPRSIMGDMAEKYL